VQSVALQTCIGARVMQMSDEYLYCWQWNRERASTTDYCSYYPGIAEQYDWHEVEIVFWTAPQEGDRDE